jgi:hypothetical protein
MAMQAFQLFRLYRNDGAMKNYYHFCDLIKRGHQHSKLDLGWIKPKAGNREK